MTEPPESVRNELGSLLRRARLERGMRVREVAEKAGISVSYLAMVESGRRRAISPFTNYWTMVRLGNILDLELRKLILNAALDRGSLEVPITEDMTPKVKKMVLDTFFAIVDGE
jgi:transcriptional regulator with XRE-family HTH domain